MVVDPDGAPARDADGFVLYQSVDASLADGTERTMIAGLRTTDGVSEAVAADQVLISIIMFGLIYLLLFVLWLFVLDLKIKAGPEPPGDVPPTDRGLLEAAGALAGSVDSLTGSKGA
jgi:hypothetical protein